MKFIKCENCASGYMQVTHNKTTGAPFLICCNGYKCSHCSMPEGCTENDFEPYMPNYDNSLIDYYCRMDEED